MKVAVCVVFVAMLLAAPAGATQRGQVVTSPAMRVTANAAENWVASRASISPGSEILWESDADLARDLDAIVATGATRTGFDIDWNSIQGNGPDTYWWHATDRVVLAARQRGLVVGGGLDYAPGWARPADCPPDSSHCLPVHVEDYARFAQAAVMRYGANSPVPALRGSITNWSIWNEPNNSEFALPKPDPVRYAELLKAAYTAIKAADPNAVVVTGGTSPAGDAVDGREISPATWLVDLYRNGAQGFFDAVGHHPYAFPNNPLDAAPWNAFTQTADLHLIMTFFGDGAKKIWGTEAGAPTGTNTVALTDAQQAQWVRDYYQAWNTTYASFTGPLSWFSHRDSGVDRNDWVQNLGLLHHDWTPKPAFAAFQSVMHAASTPPVISATTRRVVTNPSGGYYSLGGDGSVTPYGGAGYFGAPSFGWNIARGLAVMPDGQGYVVLDGFGGLHRFGSATEGAVGQAPFPYWIGWDIARDVAITPSGNGIAVLDGFGGMHASGDAPRTSPGYWLGWDIARSLDYTSSGNGTYVLDGFGGIHVVGDAVARRGPYWPGWDVAREISLTSSGKGYWVLDGLGGVHPTGDAPITGWTL